MIKHITVISPIFNEDNITIKKLINNISSVLKKISKSSNIILVDDGSNNNIWEYIKEESKKIKNLCGIRLDKNYGQHIAIKAGIDHANSKYTVVIDSDMQENPLHIYDLYKKIKTGYDVVYAERINRKDKFQNFFSELFYSLINLLGSTKYNNKIANFSIFNKKVAYKLKRNKISHISFFASLKNLNCNEGFIQVNREERNLGKAKYRFFDRLKLAKNTIVSFSNRLLYLSIIFSFLFTVLSIFLIIYFFSKKLFFYSDGLVAGWTSLAVISTFGFAITNLSIAILSLYINSIHELVKSPEIYSINNYLKIKQNYL
jgi:dolichol-phosphate mannosyltransferase